MMSRIYTQFKKSNYTRNDIHYQNRNKFFNSSL